MTRSARAGETARICALVALFSLFACSGPRSLTLEERRDSALAALRAGDLAKAIAQADTALAQPPAGPPSVLAVELRLLKAEALLNQGKVDVAGPLIDDPLPDDASFAPMRARRCLLDARRQGITARRNRQPLSAAIEALSVCIRLATEAGADAVRFDAEAFSGQVFWLDDRRKEAEEILVAARDRAASAGDHYHEAAALLNLGMLRFGRNRFDESLPYFERILSFDDLHLTSLYATALNNAGICWARLGDFDRAIDLQNRAVAAHETRGVPQYLEQALGELGNTFILKGEPRSALPLLMRAHEIASNAGLMGEAALWAGNLAHAAAAVGDWATAERFNERGLALKRELKSGKPVYNTLNSARIAAGRGRLDAARTAYLDALATASDDPGVQWEAHAGLANVFVAMGQPRDAIAQFEQALAVIEATRSELLQTDMKLFFLDRLIQFYRRYVDVLVALGDHRRALEVADASRARLMADRLGKSADRRAGIAEFMAAARRTGATLVAYWLGSTKSYAWVVTADRVTIAELAPADRISRLSIDYRRVVETSLADPLLMSESPGDTLAATILTPLMAQLPKTGHIIIVPDGALHQVNFEMLPVGTPRHYWIEDVTLAVAPSLTILASRDARRAPAATAVLLVGDPASTDSQKPALRFARQEIDSIADTFATRQVTTIRGRAASPAAYAASQPERFGIIHFAAHGTVNAQTPLDSAIELSPDTAGSKVYVRDVADRPIGATLVTISACRSANARTYAGEGLVGFAWAFLRAGARQVVAGLWNVDDQSTAELMAAFYRELASGASPAVALRTAKLAMLHRGGNFAKPYYWAPFELFVALD